MAAPIDPATGKPYKVGEVPPGCSEPISEEEAEAEAEEAEAEDSDADND